MLKNQPSISVITFIVLTASAAVQGGNLLGRDGDLAIHLSYGRAILASGGIPTVDPTIIDSTAAPVLHEWLTEVIMALCEHWFGLGPIVLATAMIPAILTLLTMRRSWSAGFWPGFISGIVVYSALGVGLTARPHMLSWVAFYALVGTNERRPWMMFTLGILWANLHAGSALVLIPLVLGAEWMLGVSWMRFASLGAALAGMCINPWGPCLYGHLLRFMLTPNPAGDFAMPSGGQLILYLSLSLWMLFVIRRNRNLLRMDQFVVMLGTLVLGAMSLRNLPYLGLAVSIHIAPASRGLFRGALRRYGSDFLRDELACSPAPWVIVTILVGLFGLYLHPVEIAGAWHPPKPIVEWVARQYDVPGYAGFNASGYLLYDTRRPVWVHALNAQIPDWERRAALLTTFDTAGPGWEQSMASEGITWFLVTAGQALDRAPKSNRWQRILSVDGWVVWEDSGVEHIITETPSVMAGIQ